MKLKGTGRRLITPPREHLLLNCRKLITLKKAKKGGFFHRLNLFIYPLTIEMEKCFMLKKLTILISFVFLLNSCGQSDEEKVKNAIETANHLLSLRKCDEALRELEGVGQQNTNSRWIIAYASAHACNGNFSEPNFFANELPKLGTNVSQDALFGLLTTFASASDTPFSTQYSALQRALEVLMYAGGSSTSSHAQRLTKFTASEVSNMEVFALYLNLTQLARYLDYYGAPSAAGVKGNCIATYTDGTAITAIDVVNTDACNSGTNTGHPDIETGVPATRHARLCHGLVLFNNFIDLISNISFTGGNTGTLSTLSTTFGTVCTTAFGAGAAVCTTKDQAACEANITNTNIERYFASIIETFYL